MKIDRVRVYPKKLLNGKYTIYQITVYDELIIRGWKTVQKSKTQLWPPCKQSNGLGARYDTIDEAYRAIWNWEKVTGKKASYDLNRKLTYA